LADPAKNLGKIVSIHGVQPALVQRAAIVAVLAFVFFLAMMAVFSYRQNLGYFILASAFLVVEIFTLMGLFAQRRNVLQIFEKGLCYKKQCRGWGEIASMTLEKAGIKITCTDGTETVIPNTLQHFDHAVNVISGSVNSKTADI
jgi:hypothetical protein